MNTSTLMWQLYLFTLPHHTILASFLTLGTYTLPIHHTRELYFVEKHEVAITQFFFNYY